MNCTIVNPKRSSRDSSVLSNTFNYHAGFSNVFVKEILSSSVFGKESIILDPWNGMGTTTYVSSSLGFDSIGIDFNPIMKVISLANHATADDMDYAIKRLNKMRVNFLPKLFKEPTESDLLFTWFTNETVNYIRYIDSYIFTKNKAALFEKLAKITPREAILYFALFGVVKEFLAPFIGSNPTWIRQKGISEEEKLSIPNSEIKSNLISFFQKKKEEILVLENREFKKPDLIYASSMNMPINTASIDVVITSPPYCTRIDYGIATLSELAVFLGYDAKEVNRIRRGLTGRTTIDEGLKISLSDLDVGAIGIKFLNEVKNHDSYASKVYYFKNLYQYFYDMDLSFKEISRVIKYGGVFICVVQDSFYKDIHCDLPKIIIEMAQIAGFVLEGKYSFDVAASLANLNKGSKKYRADIKAYEAVLVFRKV